MKMSYKTPDQIKTGDILLYRSAIEGGWMLVGEITQIDTFFQIRDLQTGTLTERRLDPTLYYVVLTVENASTHPAE